MPTLSELLTQSSDSPAALDVALKALGMGSMWDRCGIDVGSKAMDSMGRWSDEVFWGVLWVHRKLRAYPDQVRRLEWEIWWAWSQNHLVTSWRHQSKPGEIMDILWKTIDFGPLQIGVKGQALRQNLRRNAPGDCLTSCWAQKQDRTVKPTNWSERCIQTLSTAVTTGILVVLQFEQVGSWQKTCSLIAGRTLTLGCVVVDAESFFSFPLYTMFFFSWETLYTYNYTYNYT